MNRKKRVLIIDDDNDSLESMHIMLLTMGHDVATLSNSKNAVTTYKEFVPDIVLVDVMMPGIDGHETFYKIKDHDSDARVILISRYSINDEQYKLAKAKSLSGLLNKPMDYHKLEQIIKKYAK
jgi:two-component system chemotaxis response regulator CheY